MAVSENQLPRKLETVVRIEQDNGDVEFRAAYQRHDDWHVLEGVTEWGQVDAALEKLRELHVGGE